MLEDFQRNLLAAQGYLELEMYADALEELQVLPERLRSLPPVVELQLLVHMQSKAWEPALEQAETLCRLRPEVPAAFIHAAFCLHELRRTAEAKQRLMEGPTALREDATFFYNLACYECCLGDLEAARQLLAKAVEMDKKYRAFAKTDPDLAALKLP